MIVTWMCAWAAVGVLVTGLVGLLGRGGLREDQFRGLEDQDGLTAPAAGHLAVRPPAVPVA